MATSSSEPGGHDRVASSRSAPARPPDRPPASSPAALLRMQRQRRRDTKPELALRSSLHRRGLRFRVDRIVAAGSRRRADVVFARARVAVFVDGCFWHACPEHASWPKENADWWRAKIEGNRRRDRETDERLRATGWLPVRVWEHEAAEEAADRVESIVRDRLAAL